MHSVLGAAPSATHGRAGNNSLATPFVSLAMSHRANTKRCFHSQVQPVLTFPTLCSPDLAGGCSRVKQQQVSVLVPAGGHQRHVSMRFWP